MQQALLIDEIIRPIVQYTSEGGSGTLSAIARSCRAWEGPALDKLWLQLDSIEPLLNLIPGVQLINGIYILEQQPDTPSSLDRFYFYAHRVKHISHKRKAQVHPAVLAILTSCGLRPAPRPVLLPLLRTVKLSSSVFGPIQSCFSISGKLNKLDLDLGFKSTSSPSFSENIHLYLQEVAKIAPNLEHLSIRGSAPQPILSAISSMRNLRSLSLRSGATLTTDALLAIRSLHHLSELELQIGHVDHEDLSGAFSNAKGPAFPSLMKLRVRAYTPILALLLDSLPPDSLDVLHIEAEELSEVPISWGPVFDTICTKAANTLRTLNIQHHIELDDIVLDSAQAPAPAQGLSSGGVIPGGSKPNYPVTFSDLQILSTLRHLRKFVLDTTLPPAICDQELATLIKNMPELEHFELGSTPPLTDSRSQAKTLTCQSLQMFATKTPKLTTLIIPIAISVVEVPADFVRQYDLTRLTLACTCIPEPAQFAQHLHQLFPALLEVDGIPDHDEEWARVRDTLRLITSTPAAH